MTIHESQRHLGSDAATFPHIPQTDSQLDADLLRLHDMLTSLLRDDTARPRAMGTVADALFTSGHPIEVKALCGKLQTRIGTEARRLLSVQGGEAYERAVRLGNWAKVQHLEKKNFHNEVQIRGCIIRGHIPLARAYALQKAGGTQAFFQVAYEALRDAATMFDPQDPNENFWDYAQPLIYKAIDDAARARETSLARTTATNKEAAPAVPETPAEELARQGLVVAYVRQQENGGQSIQRYADVATFLSNLYLQGAKDHAMKKLRTSCSPKVGRAKLAVERLLHSFLQTFDPQDTSQKHFKSQFWDYVTQHIKEEYDKKE